MSTDRWREVTRTDPCPACGKPDWCAWSPDGELLPIVLANPDLGEQILGRTPRPPEPAESPVWAAFRVAEAFFDQAEREHEQAAFDTLSRLRHQAEARAATGGAA